MTDITPDGIRYVHAAEKRVARPFHYRWLLPKLCGNDSRRWDTVTLACLSLLPAAMILYVGRPSPARAIAAGAMVVGLSGVWKFNARHTVLVDAPGMLCALASADAFKYHLWPLGIALAVLGGCVRETSPIFAALYAWNPLALIGLAPVALRHLQREGPDVLDAGNAWVLKHPFQASAQFHFGRKYRDDLPVQSVPAAAYVLPWGGALLALGNWSPQLLGTLAVAYAQVLVATDTVRLYQWAFPVMILAAVHAVPVSFLPLLVILTLANPFASEGG